MQFYVVTIVDAIRANPLEYRLVQYLAQAPTSAGAKMNAVEHHLARPDRPGRAVRWAVVEPKTVESSVVTVSETAIALEDLERLERAHRPYVVALGG